MTINKEILTETLEFIKGLPEAHRISDMEDLNADYWYQDDFFDHEISCNEETCGTAACFAGWVYHNHVRCIHNGHQPNVPDLCDESRRLLGITQRQFDILTHPENTIEHLSKAVQILCTTEELNSRDDLLSPEELKELLALRQRGGFLYQGDDNDE